MLLLVLTVGCPSQFDCMDYVVTVGRGRFFIIPPAVQLLELENPNVGEVLFLLVDVDTLQAAASLRERDFYMGM